MKISIELDDVSLRVILAFALTIWGVSGGSGHEVMAALAALLDT